MSGVIMETRDFSSIGFDDSIISSDAGSSQDATISSNNTLNSIVSDTITRDVQGQEDKDLLVASVLVNDAIRNRNLNFKTDEQFVRAYILFNHPVFKVLLYLCIWCNLCLAIFEKPAVEGVEIPYWGTMIMEVTFLSYFLFRLIHNSYFSDQSTFWKDPKNITILVTVVVIFVDMLAYIIWVNVSSDDNAVRWSRPLRVLFLINFPENRQLRKAFRNIRRTLPDIVHVLVLFLSSIAIFALLILKLMERRGLKYPDERDYFVNYWESFWDLYVLVTTANNPDAMMPAYDNSMWFSLIFIVYIIVNLYIFMNIVLAVIYSNYKKHLKNEVKATVYHKRRLLSQAFMLLKQKINGIYVVSQKVWISLMATLRPSMSLTQVELLLYVLDEDGDRSMGKKEFMKVADLLNVELKAVRELPTWLETTFPRLYLSAPSEFFKFVVLSRYFTWFFDLLIFINAICIGLSLEEAEYFFLPVFSLEVLVKLYALGPVQFFRSFWNVFDFVIITAAVLITIIESALGNTETRSTILDVLMVLRVLRLIRLLGAIDRFNIVLTTIVNIGPSIATYGGVIFVLYYIYAIIGMEIFSGLIQYYGYDENNPDQTKMWCGNPKLEDSEFYKKHYCSNNFNNLLSSFVVLFELMVVNQWHVITSGYVLSTNKAARLYFISFHMLCVIILLNILTAFVLEVFILEYTLSKGKLEAAVETKIKEMGLGEGQKILGRKKLDRTQLVDNMEVDDPTTETPKNGVDENANVSSWDKDRGLRFKLSSRTKGVEMMLQLMFEGEIDPEDEGLDQSTEDQLNLNFNSLTF